ncbi:hypothetical protein AB1A81_08595 [Bdellovibrio bacteriovorus]|uniref:Uncharacterized protein n=1 Tax=Bdellovibrio bacteriovorus (strain ATCC 15356 / DSM 50701 / NCIMB 9529 / HD100) TaxID=264462 RepID=Q6MLW7_BDEBA|nr:hypothetical protein [Bdellovibrio bacteriovorus]AHZ84388.1 hypothetical protein EP01_05490 [Bdellovibrio bacteriovorus]BEV68277.1 hypothetical protein Bb109J_c1697 [Bdellovibrio bacteriovorus]CAE79739.1 hypothetical protein predicted by Glimmer/Critica [Bdellovibrio bacteriovorus HD100]
MRYEGAFTSQGCLLNSLKSTVAVAVVLLLSSVAFGKDCTVLVSSHYRDELREVIRSELSGQGVTALFADELQVQCGEKLLPLRGA